MVKIEIHFTNSVVETEEITNAIKHDLFDYFTDEDGCIHPPTIKRNLAIQDQLERMGYNGVYGAHWEFIEYIILKP